MDAFNFYWSKTNENDSLYYIDYNSLYPSVASDDRYLFPTGIPEIIVNPTILKNISCKDQKCLLKNDNGNQREIHGLAHVSIIAPKHLLIPFLPYRIKSKSICALCRTCAEYENQKPCSHSSAERAFTSVYTLQEIAFAVSIGYRVLHWYEVYAYRTAQPIFKKFLQVLASFKIRNAGFPQGIEHDSDKEKYCQQVNRKMNFYHKDLFLTPDNVTENKQLRDAFKLGSNSLLGKLSQDPDLDQQAFLSNQKDLEKLFYNEAFEITDLIAISDFVLQARVKWREGFNRPNYKGSVVLGSYVTSAARIEMYKCFQKCQNKGARIYYTDTDSIILGINKNIPIPLPFGNAYGEFKHEVDGEILSFYSLGPKNYCLTVKQNEKEELTHTVKARGFYLKSGWSLQEVNVNTFRTFIDSLLQDGENSLVKYVPQFQIRTNKNTRQLSSVLYFKQFRNDTYNKRVYFTGPNKPHYTLPFGYSQKMFDAIIA